MNPEEFAKRIREKYPSVYDDIDDVELTNRVIAKYPVYKDQVSFDVEPVGEPPSPVIETFKAGGERIVEEAGKIGEQETIGEEALQVAKTAGIGAIDVFKGTGSLLVEPFRLAFNKLPSDFREKLGATFEEGLAKTMEALPDAAKQRLSSIATKLEQNPEFAEIAQDTADLIFNTVGLGVAKKAEAPIRKVAGEVIETAQEQALKTKGVVAEKVIKGKEIPSKIKEKITGIPKAKGEAKITEDSVSIAREKITPKIEKEAAAQGRTIKEGRVGGIKIKPSKKEELLSDSIRHLVESGDIKAKALPFENIPRIKQEVSRINLGIREMLADRKIPFNVNQLRKKLNDVKKDSDIVFTTDPTLERTYDSLVNAFIKEVSKKDTLGLFEARQSFDKLPAVKKLLDSVKGAQGESLRRESVLDIRRAANEFVSEQMEKSGQFKGSPFLSLLKEESRMLEVVDNLAVKSKGLEGTTNLSRFLEDNPALKTLLKQAAPFGAGALVF